MAKKERPLLGAMLEKLAPKIGATVSMEPRWKVVGQLTFKNGKRSYFRYSSLGINPLGASEICKDKDYTTFFLRKMRYPTPVGKAFFRDDFAAAIGLKENSEAAVRYAARIGFPLLSKPNSGSQGRHVAIVQNERELRGALKRIFKDDRVALVQTILSGDDYRIVILDNEVISAYKRIPLSVVGDGRASIRQLLARKQKEFTASSRDTRLRPDDPRISAKLRRQKYAFSSVPKKGERIFLLDNANLSSGGDAVDVTRLMHPAFKKLAVAITKDMGLRLSGVDLMVQGDITKPPKKYWVLEVNAAPGLDHYIKVGKAQETIVEALYLKILRAMASG